MTKSVESEFLKVWPVQVFELIGIDLNQSNSSLWHDTQYNERRVLQKFTFQSILCADKAVLLSFEKCNFKAKQKEMKTLKFYQ